MTESPHRSVPLSPRPPPRGTLYGLGLGPGDPELITLKALRILRSVPNLLVPVRRVSDSGYAWAIAQPHLEPSARQRVLRLPFPGECDERMLDEQWDRNCQRVLEMLLGGEDAAFLTEGDPLLYSTFIHLAERLRSANPALSIEVVAGVSSITAAAAAAAVPLAARGGRLAVVPAMYDPAELRQTLREFETVVLLKVSPALERVVALLDELGLAERAVLVERCGRPEQRIVRGLSGPLTADYLSLIIVRK